MKIDWNRVKRTAIQAGAGAGVALLTAVANDMSAPAIKAAVCGFVVTLGIAVLMNLKQQADEAEQIENKVGDGDD